MIQGTCQLTPGSFGFGFDYCSMTPRYWQLDMGCLGGVKKVPKTIHLLTFMIPTFGICMSPYLPERPPLLPGASRITQGARGSRRGRERGGKRFSDDGARDGWGGFAAKE